MYQTIHLITVPVRSQVFVEMVSMVLREAGLQIIQSFDLQVAKTAHTHCTCPYHGSELCDCQMIILLVYKPDYQPVSLVVHGKDGITHLGILDDPNRQSSSGIENMIRNALVSV
jgi:hypothetical protein